MWPSEGSLVVGPIDPATKRGLSLVENCCATSFAIFAAAMLISATLSCRSYSRQHDTGRAESVGLDHIAADFEKVSVNVLDDVGPAEDQQFVAALLAPEIVHTGVAELNVSPHGAVVNDDAVAHGLEKVRHCKSVSAISRRSLQQYSLGRHPLPIRVNRANRGQELDGSLQTQTPARCGTGV